MGKRDIIEVDVRTRALARNSVNTRLSAGAAVVLSPDRTCQLQLYGYPLDNTTIILFEFGTINDNSIIIVTF